MPLRGKLRSRQLYLNLSRVAQSNKPVGSAKPKKVYNMKKVLYVFVPHAVRHGRTFAQCVGLASMVSGENEQLAHMARQEADMVLVNRAGNASGLYWDAGNRRVVYPDGGVGPLQYDQCASVIIEVPDNEPIREIYDDVAVKY